MKFINGTNRNQLPLFASSIDDAIAQDNEMLTSVQFIGAFIDFLITVNSNEQKYVIYAYMFAIKF